MSSKISKMRFTAEATSTYWESIAIIDGLRSVSDVEKFAVSMGTKINRKVVTIKLDNKSEPYSLLDIALLSD